MILYLESFLNSISLSSFSLNTISSYKKDISNFLFFFSNKNILHLESKDFNLYFHYLANKKYSTSTINRNYSSINGFYKFLFKNNIIEANLFTKIKKIKEKIKLPKTIENEDIKKILNYYDKNIINKKFIKEKSLIYLMIFTGMRVSEICAIKKNTFKFHNENEPYSMINVIGKRNKERILPCNNLTIKTVKEFINISNNNSQYVFSSNSKFGYISRVSVLKLIKKIQLKLNIKYNISPHMFRHSFATNLLNKNMDLRYIQDILGHSNLSTTAIYTEVNDKKLKKDLEKFHPEFQN
jgi:integrase/recombinase XerD